ncbi:MAG: hydrogenase 3 maturation endopeptidase HyCI [Candidatus Bathyarchaeota archaeon]|nr:MAG: hydrogenase 3 maturation endopeptidase HyCI [Candidatus Bathyarchaeota archaeon]
MNVLKEQLRRLLQKDARGRVVIVGIGNPLRGDDAVGLAVIDHLEQKSLEDVLLLRAESAPENFTGPIREYEPTHLLLVDSAGLNLAPGAARVISTDEIMESRISTHTSSLKVLITFLELTTGTRVTLIGVQPLSMEFGEGLSSVAKAAAKEVADVIFDVLEGCRGTS